MPSNVARYNFLFILIHWLVALLIFFLLGLGWYIQYMPPDSPARSFFIDLHISLGLTSAILIFIQLFLRLLFKPPSFPNEFPRWRKALSYLLYLVMYACLILMPISGYLWTVFSGTPIKFWGTPLSLWGVVDPTVATLFENLHETTAVVLGGAITAHVGLVVLNIIQHPGIASRMLLFGAAAPRVVAVVSETQSSIASEKAQSFAKNLRIFGWIGFWVQFALAFISGLLLAFATSGSVFSPSGAGFGDAIYWASDGFFVLCAAVLLALYYTHVARKIASRPDPYLNRTSRAAFWFLGVGILIGLIGVAISFTGLALSISLLIAKVVSQPPGIAITDPHNIIRALDVFVLLVNFSLLMGHFVGMGISLWLGILVSKVHLAYVERRERGGRQD